MAAKKVYSIIAHGTDVKTRLLSQLHKKFVDGELRTDHALQRESGVHNPRTRDGIIVSAILHENFDSIKICEQVHDDGTITYWLIDGKQRMTDITDYIQLKFKLGKKIRKPLIGYQRIVRDDNGNIVTDENGRQVKETAVFDLRGKYFSDLPEEIKENFLNCELQCTTHYNCEDSDVAYHIYRYNSITPMNPSQKGILSMPNIAGYVKKICHSNFFLECTDLTEQKGHISNLIAEMIMLINFYDNWNKNSEDRGDFLDENATKDMFDKLSNQLDRLYEVVDGETCEIFNKHSLPIIKFFDEFCDMGLEDEVFAEFLNFFVDNMDTEVNGKTYNEVATRNTKDKGVINRKLEVIRDLFQMFIGTSDNVSVSEDNSEVSPENIYGETGCVNEDKEIFDVNNVETVDDFINIVNSIANDNETVREFVNNVADDTIDEDDMRILEEDFDSITLEVDNSNPILDSENMKSLMAIMAYSYKEDLNFEDWFKDYAGRKSDYLFNQRENYKLMLADLLSYCGSVA